ncbi:hypothetical protein HAX54_045150 [Datura stramonium]|uniref:Uncharacterized protein n=1 Tax=Datura stramonium TaxID=4076 RepID=A0ABS8SQ10_DATST|nr:hypothetical protein [Datura stramonium]
MQGSFLTQRTGPVGLRDSWIFVAFAIAKQHSLWQFSGQLASLQHLREHHLVARSRRPSPLTCVEPGTHNPEGNATRILGKSVCLPSSKLVFDLTQTSRDANQYANHT